MIAKYVKQPLYYRIKEDIKKQIENKKLNPGDFLPTEKSLCELYNVSRVTIRKAISELISEGLVVRDYSKMACVAGKHVARDLNYLGGLHEVLSKQGIKVSSYVLKSELIQADKKISEAMKIEEGTPVLFIDRLRYADSDPIAQQLLYIRIDLCPGLEAKDLINQSFYELLEKKYHYKIKSATQTINARTATYKQAALLEISKETNMLYIVRNTYLDNDECIEYSVNYYIANKYDLTMTLYR